MPLWKEDVFRIGLWSEQRVELEHLGIFVLCATHVEGGEVELGGHPLSVKLIFIAKFHPLKDWTSYTHEELWHLKDLTALTVPWDPEFLRVYLLCYSIEMSKDYSSLGKAENSIKGSISSQNINEVGDYLLEACHHIWSGDCFLLGTERLVKDEPGSEMH